MLTERLLLALGVALSLAGVLILINAARQGEIKRYIRLRRSFRQMSDPSPGSPNYVEACMRRMDLLSEVSDISGRHLIPGVILTIVGVMTIFMVVTIR